MSYFILQSLLLIAVAYLLGAMLGCGLRKMFANSASILHRVNDDMPVAETAAIATAATATATGMATDSVARRLAARDGEASIEINRSSSKPAVEVPTYDESVEVHVETLPVEPEIRSHEDHPLVPEQPVEQQHDIPVPVVEETVEEVIVREEITPEVTPEKVEEKPDEPPVIDDLTRIKGIGLPVALELKKNGITRFYQIARWTDEDVAEISRKFGFSGRIERENWMDQAKILAQGDEIEFTTHQLEEVEKPRPSHSLNGRSVGTYTIVSETGGDDLKRIVGIGPVIERQLNDLGIVSFAQIASWSDDEIEAISRQLDVEGRIELEDWVGQARKLNR